MKNPQEVETIYPLNELEDDRSEEELLKLDDRVRVDAQQDREGARDGARDHEDVVEVPSRTPECLKAESVCRSEEQARQNSADERGGATRDEQDRTTRSAT